MDTVIRQLTTEFCAPLGLEGWTEAELFEVFATYCVLSDHTFEPFDATDFQVGGSADGGIDGFAVVVNERPFRDPIALESFLTGTAEASATIVVLQAKSSPKMDRKFISDLRVRVENIVRTDLKLDNADAVESLRDCLRVLGTHLDRLNSDGPRLVVAYASTSQGANDEMRREAERAAESLSGKGIVSQASFHCLGRDELARLYERAQWSATAKLTFTEYYRSPRAYGLGQVRQGVVSAQELVQALSDDTGTLNPALFSENIREFQPEATVNDEMRQTLRDESRRRRFAVLNNGVTIVARSLRGWAGATVVMRDFQVVNGCQTCHVLGAERDLLDGVNVKVQLIECDDDDIVNDIVMATNRQTEIPRAYFLNRRVLLRRLEVYYRSRRADGYALYFGRRPERKRPNDLRNGVISLNGQLRAYVAMFGPLEPSRDHRNLEADFDKLFKHATEAEFFTAGAALYRWHRLVEGKRVAQRFRSLGYQAVAVLGILHGLRPLRGSDKDKTRRLNEVLDVVWSQGGWERLAVDIQEVLNEALATTELDHKAAASSLTFGRTVVELANQRAGAG